MNSEFTRRDFMKTASATTAGVTMATRFSPRAYAANEKVRVACIGTGGQGTFHIRDGLTGAADMQIVAVCDIFTPHQKAGTLYGWVSNAGVYLEPGQKPGDLDTASKNRIKAAHKPKSYYDYREMLAQEEIDAVVIATPLHTHYQLAMDCLDAGKYVFCEKTLTKTIEESRDIVKKCHETGRFLQVGHQRRYNPKYNVGMNIAHKRGMLGRINHIVTQWHRNHYWRRDTSVYQPLTDQEVALAKELVGVEDIEHLLNWRMYKATSGGLFTELATHQCDIANWFMMSVPVSVYATGGIDYWRDGREVDDNITITYEYRQHPSDPGFQTVEKRSRLQKMAKINKSYTVRYAHSNILANARGGAFELLEGDYGTLNLTENPALPCMFYMEDAKVEKVKKEGGGDAITSLATLQRSPEELAKGIEILADIKLKTADVYQFEAMARHIKEGGVPRTNQMVGLTTAISGLAALRSREEGRKIDIDPAWYTFDFETPSFHDYDDSWKAPEKPEPKAVPKEGAPKAATEKA